MRCKQRLIETIIRNVEQSNCKPSQELEAILSQGYSTIRILKRDPNHIKSYQCIRRTGDLPLPLQIFSIHMMDGEDILRY